MPKDEFDFDDPLELNGVALLTNEDTLQPMAECFVEEFMRLGYNHKQILALFRNPHYLGMNLVMQNKGEAFVQEIIAATFARRGKKIAWSAQQNDQHRASTPTQPGNTGIPVGMSPGISDQLIEFDPTATDPTGEPVPKLNL